MLPNMWPICALYAPTVCLVGERCHQAYNGQNDGPKPLTGAPFPCIFLRFLAFSRSPRVFALFRPVRTPPPKNTMEGCKALQE